VLLAGEQALNHGAMIESLSFLDRGIELQQSHTLSALQLARAYRLRTEALFGLGRLDAVIESSNQVLTTLGNSLPKKSWSLVSAILQEISHQLLSHIQNRKPNKQIQPTEFEEVYRTLWTMAQAYGWLGIYSYFVYAILKMLNISELQDKIVPVVHGYISVAYILRLLLLPQLADFYDKKAQALVKIHGIDATSIDGLWTQGLLYLGQGRWSEANNNFQRVEEIAQRSGDEPYLLRNELQRIGIAYLKGDFRQVAERIEYFESSAIRGANKQYITWASGIRGLMFLHKGLFEDALQHFQQAQKNLHYINDAVVEIFVMGQLALTQIRLGNLTSAHQLADELLRKLLADKFTGYGITGYGFLEGYPSLVEVYLAVWQSEQIDIEPLKLEKKIKQALKILDHYSRVFPIGKPRALLLQGLYKSFQGHTTKAHQHWQHSLNHALAIDMTYEQGLINYTIGRYPLSDNTESVTQLNNLKQAIVIFEELGAIWELEQAQLAYQLLNSELT